MNPKVVAIKSATGTWTIRVLAAPFGHPAQKDSHGQYFDNQTDFADDVWPLPPFVYYHGYDKPGRESRRPIYIGKSARVWVDSEGRWYEGPLDQSVPESKKVWEAALKGEAVGSPGTLEHLIRVGPNGHLDHWPIAEVSIFDQLDGKRPANRRAIAVPVIKSLYQEAGLNLPDIEQSLQATSGKGARSQRPAPATAINQQSTKSLENSTMDEEELKKMIADLVAQGVAEAMAAQQAAAAAKAAEEAKMEEEVNKRVEAAKADMAKKAAEDRRLPWSGGAAPHVAQFSDVSKFDNLDLADHAFMSGVLGAAKKAGRSEYGSSESSMKAFAIKAAEDQTWIGERARQAIKAANPGIDLKALKANEINRADLASYGAEWVSDAWANAMWENIRISTPIVANLPTVEIPQGADNLTIPLESAAPTFYKVAAAADLNATTGRPNATVNATKLGTANRTITTSKIGARVVWDGEMEEDSILPWVSELRSSIEKEGAEIMESVVIDGDIATTATTNINDIGNLSAQSATNYWLLFDGFRKLALVTNTANSRDGGVLALDDYLETVKLLGVSGINALDRSKVAFIVDPLTYYKSLTLTQVQTRDLFSNPTIEGGELTGLYGYRLLVSANACRSSSTRLSNASGKVDLTTPANNTKGQIAAIRWDQWRFGFKRRMTIEVARMIDSDTNQIVALSRVGLINRDNEASAVSYNLTV
ncbi:hypothetical protein [Herpetosiphon geysericola]|uniref:Uncharacterized protein n=1 Tax=Herpetosiphon geysericola TaxID=70996 RepID=A0A0P6YZY4_9CHLR|nr:hypothetical protein [Herpetosiphon geysericola]KPL90763.1 hypothetical protein SE18_05195 [Herpetosiphon geysericola]